MHRLLEDEESRLVIIEFIMLCDRSPPDTSCRNCWCCVVTIHHKGRNSLLLFFPGWVTLGRLAFPNPLELAVVVRHSQIFFFPLFQNSNWEGSPYTTRPYGTANKPSGYKRKGRFSMVLDFLSLSASSGSWEKSSRAGWLSSEQLYQKAWEAGSGKSHLVVMWVWKAYEKERAEENILLELNK